MTPRTPWAVALLLVLLAPPALGHGMTPGETPEGGGTREPEEAHPHTGYTGPGREPYLYFFEGAWAYGQLAATPLGNQTPRGVRGDGDWLVWEDANRGDVFVYNVPAGTGFHLQGDGLVQRAPAISGNVVVYEQLDRRGSDVYAYFLDTAETRRLSAGPGNQRNPTVWGDLVAWEDDRSGDLDVWGYSLTNRTEFPVHVSPDRDSDPLAFRGSVYLRAYRFNVFDVFRVDLERNQTTQVTTDARAEGAPFTNGDEVLFLSLQRHGWELRRYLPDQDRVVPTSLVSGDAKPMTASGDRVLVSTRDMAYHQLVARNLTSGVTTHVTGNLLLTDEPLLLGRTAYAPVRTANGTSLLALDVSPFAFTAPPRIAVASPYNGMAWTQPVAVTGTLAGGAGWTAPATFTYRVGDEAPTAILPDASWRFTLDPAGYEPGRHVVTVRATFREGPPVEQSVVLVVPGELQTVDVEEYGRLYHSARVFGTLNEYLLANPAAWVVLVLGLVILALVLLRLWLLLRPRRARPAVEYVPPE